MWQSVVDDTQNACDKTSSDVRVVSLREHIDWTQGDDNARCHTAYISHEQLNEQAVDLSHSWVGRRLMCGS